MRRRVRPRPALAPPPAPPHLPREVSVGSRSVGLASRAPRGDQHVHGGAAVAEGSALFRAVSGAIEAATGEAPHVNPMHTSSDIRVPAVQHGVPCVGFGSRSGNLAQNGLADEWIDLDDFGRMVEAVTGVVKEWCGTCTDDTTGASGSATAPARATCKRARAVSRCSSPSEPSSSFRLRSWR